MSKFGLSKAEFEQKMEDLSLKRGADHMNGTYAQGITGFMTARRLRAEGQNDLQVAAAIQTANGGMIYTPPLVPDIIQNLRELGVDELNPLMTEAGLQNWKNAELTVNPATIGFVSKNGIYNVRLNDLYGLTNRKELAAYLVKDGFIFRQLSKADEYINGFHRRPG